MELQFEAKSREVWQESLYREERILVDLEGVVPDVNEDVGRVASVRCTVLLKSKDVDTEGVRIGGEVEAILLCITENADAVQSVTLRKEFEERIAAPGTKLREAQAAVRVLRTEARVLNPRKLALRVELGAAVSGWEKGEQVLSLLPSEGDESLLNGLAENAEMQPVTGVSEKSFALTESFAFPQERATPLRILGGEAAFCFSEQSRIGSRLIVKGAMELSVLYEGEGQSWPLLQRFSTPVSQILDLGGENVCCCTIQCETTTLYLDLTDSISGGKALEAEIHAVMQIASRQSEIMECLRDAYSNVMPLTCTQKTLYAPQAGEMLRSVYSASEMIGVAEDCVDVLSVLPALTREDDGLRAEMDILYRSRNGDLSAVRRCVPLTGEVLPQDARILSTGLTRCDLQPDGEGMQCELTAEIRWQRLGNTELQAVSSVTADDEHPYDRSAFPAVTLVRSDGESLFALARTYHSSVSAIEEMNGAETDAGSMLLIPRV